MGGIIPLDFVGSPFKTSKSKNDINYSKYKFSHRFGKHGKWLNMYYSNIRIIIFFKVITMSIWIILKNLVWTCKEYFLPLWTIVYCAFTRYQQRLFLQFDDTLKGFKVLKDKSRLMVCWNLTIPNRYFMFIGNFNRKPLFFLCNCSQGFLR